MPGWVGEHPPLIAAGLEHRLGRTQLHQHGLGLVKIVNSEVEVELLRHALARPLRRPVAIDPLETDEQPAIVGEPGESSSDSGTSSSPVVC